MVAVQDAYRRVRSHVLYGCEARWWHHYSGCKDFPGEKWSSHGLVDAIDDKQEVSVSYGVNLVKGKREPGFSLDPSRIHYGDNSGFQAVNLAMLMGAKFIVLVGFDMRDVEGKAHFFGAHPDGLNRTRGYEDFIKKFDQAAKTLPDEYTIINATPGSALKCFPMMPFEEAIAAYRGRSHGRLHRDRPVSDVRAD